MNEKSAPDKAGAKGATSGTAPPDATVIVENHGAVRLVTINRPAVRNALNKAAGRELARVFSEFAEDDSAKVAVLTGAGGHFCAGADLKELAGGTDYEPWATSEWGPTRHLLPKPVIAAVSGYACAGGLGLALWCDLRIVDETTVFGIYSRRWGVPMSDGTTVRLPRLIGVGRAMDLMLTGRSVDADEAVQIGLATRKTVKGETVAAALEMAEQISAFPEIAMRSDRMSVYRGFDQGLVAALQQETAFAQQARRKSAQAGAARFAAGAGRHGAKVSAENGK